MQRLTVLTKIQIQPVKDQHYNKNFDLSLRNIQEADPNHQQGKHQKQINKINPMK